MTKWRSANNYATQDAGQKRGWLLGLEEFVFIAEESVPGTFTVPSIGTRGSSTSAAAPSTDISAEAVPAQIGVAVDGEAVTNVSLASVTGLTTGTLIAAALETEINTDLATAGRKGRVSVAFSGGLYVVRSQKVGVTSAVVITAGTANDLAVELKLGSGNAGVEAVGTNGTGFLLTTKAGLRYTQAREISRHKTGRQPVNVIKKKRMFEGDLELYCNLGTGGTPTIDASVALLLEQLFGKKTVVGSTSIDFDASQAPNKFFSLHQSSNAHSQTVTGCYIKTLSIAIPGDAEALMTMTLKGRDAKIATTGVVDTAVAASATVPLEDQDSSGFEAGARVMGVDVDGVTVLAGAEGDLSVSSVTSPNVVLSAAVTLPEGAFLVPWAPQYLGKGAVAATDNPATSLEGRVTVDGDVIEEFDTIDVNFDPKFEDLDNIYGQSSNYGYIPGSRIEATVSLGLRMSAAQYRRVIKAKNQEAAAVVVTIGSPSGRRIEVTMPRVIFDTPAVEFPEEGSVAVTLEGKLLQSESGALDMITLSYK